MLGGKAQSKKSSGDFFDKLTVCENTGFSQTVFSYIAFICGGSEKGEGKAFSPPLAAYFTMNATLALSVSPLSSVKTTTAV